MTRRFGSGTQWESMVGYSRAVAAGDLVWVAGCTSTRDGELVHPGDAYEQARQALRNVEIALRGLDAELSDVVQTRIYVTDITQWADIGRAHAEVFAAAPPVTTMVQVVALIDPRMLVEVEALAFKRGSSW